MLSCPAEPYLTDKLLPNLSMKIIQKKSSRSSADSPPSSSMPRTVLWMTWAQWLYKMSQVPHLWESLLGSVGTTSHLLCSSNFWLSDVTVSGPLGAYYWPDTCQECLKHGLLRRSLGLHSCQRSKPNGPSPRHLLLYLFHSGDFK